jgi:hypothetical protein
MKAGSGLQIHDKLVGAVIRGKIEVKMHRPIVWAGSAFWSICFLWQGLCQTGFSQGTEVPDPQTYLVFFREVKFLKLESDRILLNGVATTIKHITVPEATGLTDHETQILNAIAEDCEAKVGRIDEAVRALTLEALLNSLASDGASKPVAQRLRGLDNQRDDIVREQIQRLKAELGASRFEVLNAYIRSKKSGTPFFPLVGPVPVLRRK